MASDTSNLIRRLRKVPGCTVTPSRKHWLVHYNGKLITTLSLSPNAGKRGIENSRAQLRRAGVPLS